MTDSLPFRIGHGYDVHRFGAGDHIVLGGVRIAHEAAFIAHSDGDVLVHALCDALLGAIGAGDIGRHFPDTDEQYRGIDSCRLLERVYAMVEAEGYGLANVDVTVVAQSPRLAPHLPAMKEQLSPLLSIQPQQLNIKATTTESLGFTGRREGVAVHAVVLLAKQG